ncbi:MAG: 2-amino-4-hydroxy-6-hydroxymethyldihydropteridine diphosphokinase [Bacteroidales bacterium]|nr:2-amino-4-hydroxy-6-hydroxymethyldihydropteridine diphosphokinase [Bacteroidales bacterium]
MRKISKMEKCYVLFGSNMGDKEEIFVQACLLINNRCGTIADLSAAYESEPWGFVADEWFLNRVIVLETELDPEELLRRLLDIEARLGRVRYPGSEGYTSRTADLDILYYGDRVIMTERLTVPHPRLQQRRFALLPMCDVAPMLVHPLLHMTQIELLQACPDTSIVREIPTETIEEQ